jgi:methylthioxylose transferase
VTTETRPRPAPEAARRAGAPAWVRSVLPGAGMVLVVLFCVLWGIWLGRRGRHLHLGGPGPFSGSWDLRFGLRTLVPVAAGVALVAYWPALADRLSWRRLLLAAYGAALGWALALVVVDTYRDGGTALGASLTTPWQYPVDVPRVHGLHHFLTTYNEHVLPHAGTWAWTTEPSGHPPLTLLAFVALQRIGLGGAQWAGAFCVLVGCLAVPAALTTVRAVVGEPAARRVAVFVAAPVFVLWLATSADAIFLGVTTCGIALLATAAGPARAAAGGVLLACALYLSYGMVLAGVVALAVLALRRRFRLLVAGGLGVLAVVAAMYALGFDWFAGLDVVSRRVKAGYGWRERPDAYFAVANLAVFATAVGPAGLAGLAHLRWRSRQAVLPLAGMAAVAAAELSDLSKGEVERIWMPFALWTLTATAALPGGRWGNRRVWLAVQLAVALLLATLLNSSW